ncbi:MAG TPA: ABC transporter ATP-binding protein, partial [Terriglobales bacterium]|nr:ABC transporter ATP-binding protein [Terriglobales bacterium]
LRTWFFTRDGIVRAVDGVSFAVAPGETLAVVGESGCGKSVTALSILRLIPSPPGRIVGGAIRFAGRDLLGLGEAAMRRVRGNEISMIFQEPMTSLNPVLTIGRQIAETLTLHQGLDRAAALDRAADMLRRVHIPEVRRRLGEYPHQLSGGMRQRVMIAIALACGPKLLFADEPTTALDVTVQAQILDLLQQQQRERFMAMVLVTHDLGVVAGRTDDIAVMYAGRIVERAPTRSLFEHTRMPYTQALLRAIPRLDHDSHTRLLAIGGRPPDLVDPPPGCRFAPRCDRVRDRCREDEPPLGADSDPGHQFACWYPVGAPS